MESDTALARAERAALTAESLHAAGFLSGAARTAAKVAHDDAAARRGQQRLRLWGQYLAYEFAVGMD